jgi:hypothetical protein
MTFYVGQKVVCIKAGKWKLNRAHAQVFPGPALGEVCVVAGFAFDGCGDLQLKEYGIKYVYNPIFFRPAVSPGMDVLEAIKANPNHSINAPEGPLRMPKHAKVEGK